MKEIMEMMRTGVKFIVINHKSIKFLMIMTPICYGRFPLKIGQKKS